MPNKSFTNKAILPKEGYVGQHYSAPAFIGDCTGASIHITWDGSPEATFTLQSSNDPRVSSRPDDARWFSEGTTISGCDGSVADGDVVVHLDNINTSYVRVAANVTVSGTIGIWASSKA